MRPPLLADGTGVECKRLRFILAENLERLPRGLQVGEAGGALVARAQVIGHRTAKRGVQLVIDEIDQQVANLFAVHLSSSPR